MNLHATAIAVFSYAMQSGLLLFIGLLLPKVLRLRHPTILLVYWRVLLLAVLVLPLVLTTWQWQTPIPMIEIDALTVETIVATTLPDEISIITWQSIAFVVAAVAMLALVRLIIGLVYLRRCRGAANPLAPTPPPVAAIQKRLGMAVPFLLSDRLTVPITLGWWKPAVLVPHTFEEMSADEQEGVACHELLHVRRRDWPMTVLEEVLRAVLWFHPAVWVLLSKITLSREQVVDASAVRLTGKRRQYLDALWQIVCSYKRQAVVTAVPMLGRRHLFERVALLKKEIFMSKIRIVISISVLVFAVAAAGMLGASVFPSTSHVAMSSSGMPSADMGEKKEKSDGEKLETTKGVDCDEITHPVAVEKINPKYPEEARKAKTMGMVVLRAVITEEGIVEDIEVLESPDDLLSAAAVEALNQWHFEPALCDGTPVGVWYNLTFNFNLK